MQRRSRPTYPLAAVHAAVRAGAYRIRLSAATSAQALGFDEYDVIDCVLSLTEQVFYKTMPATNPEAAALGLWQDVYRPTYRDIRLYVKLQMAADEWAVVISFKEL